MPSRVFVVKIDPDDPIHAYFSVQQVKRTWVLRPKSSSSDLAQFEPNAIASSDTSNESRAAVALVTCIESLPFTLSPQSEFLVSLTQKPRQRGVVIRPGKAFTFGGRAPFAEAALIQSRGKLHGGSNACKRCQRGNGPFEGCVTLEGAAEGTCANCKYGYNRSQCEHYKRHIQDKKAERTRAGEEPQRAQHYPGVGSSGSSGGASTLGNSLASLPQRKRREVERVPLTAGPVSSNLRSRGQSRRLEAEEKPIIKKPFTGCTSRIRMKRIHLNVKPMVRRSPPPNSNEIQSQPQTLPQRSPAPPVTLSARRAGPNPNPNPTTPDSGPNSSHSNPSPTPRPRPAIRNNHRSVAPRNNVMPENSRQKARLLKSHAALARLVDELKWEKTRIDKTIQEVGGRLIKMDAMLDRVSGGLITLGEELDH